MKTLRNLSAKELIKTLKTYGYETVSQKGSHIKVTTQLNGEHHLAIPNHDPLKIGTLNSILRQVAKHFGQTKEDMLIKLFS